MTIKLQRTDNGYLESITKGFKAMEDSFSAPLVDKFTPDMVNINFMLQYSPLMAFTSDDAFIGLILSDESPIYTCEGNKTRDYLDKFDNIYYKQVFFGEDGHNIPLFLDLIEKNCQFNFLDKIYFEMIRGAGFHNFVVSENKLFARAPLSAQIFDRSILNESDVFYDRFGISIEQFQQRFQHTG